MLQVTRDISKSWKGKICNLGHALPKIIIQNRRDEEFLRQVKTKRIQQYLAYFKENIEKSSLHSSKEVRIYRKEKNPQLENKSLK